MKDDFKQVETMRYWCQKVLPLVYDDSLSYYELLGKIVKKLNALIENNAILPDYISKLIQEYISSGAIGEVIRDILTNFMLNVKNPPNGLTPAVGDGTADDTEAIQGCIDYANENGGMAVYFPSGSYLTKSLTMRSNVSLVGFDRYNTRLVLRGGATKGMLEGDVENITINRICFDGNADIQINNINIINMKVNNAIINDVVVTDGFNLIELETNGNIQINNVIFKHGVLNGLILKGIGLVQAINLMFDSLSDLLGENAVRVLVDNAVITNVTSKVKVFNPIQVTGNNCLIEGKLLGGTTNVIDTGTNNTVRILGVKDTTKLTETYEIVANDIELNPANPLTYKTPSELNEYFKTVPFKDSNGNNYNVLVQGSEGVKGAIDNIITELEQEITDRENSDSDIYGKINTEKTDREQAISGLNDKLTQETTERVNADNGIYVKISEESTERKEADENLLTQIKRVSNPSYIEQLNNKKVVFLGDSIAFGYGWTRTDQDEIGWTPTGWGRIIQENNPSCLVKNVSQSSATLSNRLADNNIIMQVDELVANKTSYTPDYIFLQGGINDTSANVDVGYAHDGIVYDNSQSYLSTVCGALDYMYYTLKTNFPLARIGFISSTICIERNYKPYLNAIKKVSNKWSIPVLDLWNMSELNPNLQSINNMFFFESDGIHPLENGYRMFITPKINGWIKGDMGYEVTKSENWELIGESSASSGYNINKRLESYEEVCYTISIPEYFYHNLTGVIPRATIYEYGRYENISGGDLICQLEIGYQGVKIGILKYGETSYILPESQTTIKLYGKR